MNLIKSYIIRLDGATPGLNTVSTDGVTITGDGTPGSPLAVIGGLYDDAGAADAALAAANAYTDAAVAGGGQAFAADIAVVLAGGATFGQYSNGETAPFEGLTAIEAITLALGGYVDPVFGSFSIPAQATTVEVGTTLSGSKTFTWSITENSGNIDDIDIYDITAAVNIATNTPNDGTQAVTVTTNQLNTNGATQQWRGVGHDLTEVQDINSSTFTVTARYYRFYGPAASSPANSAAVRALGTSTLHTGASTFNLLTGASLTKFVVALPPGVTISQVVDLDAANTVITSDYVLTGTVNVLDAGGTSRAYNIYEMNVAVPYDVSHRHQITTAN